MWGIPLPGRTEVQWMPGVIGILSGSFVDFIVRDQLPPWSGAAVIHDPLILLGSIIKAHDRCQHDVRLWIRSVEVGIRKRWWIFWGRLDEIGVEGGLCASLKDNGRVEKGFLRFDRCWMIGWKRPRPNWTCRNTHNQLITMQVKSSWLNLR